MNLLADIFSVVAVSAGAVFYLAGTLGLLRFPDALCRVHALTKADNLGLSLVVLGLLPRMPDIFSVLKLGLVWMFLLLSSSVTAQLVGQLAQRAEAGPREPSNP